MLQRAIEFGRQSGADDSLVQDAQRVSFGLIDTMCQSPSRYLLPDLLIWGHGRGWRR